MQPHRRYHNLEHVRAVLRDSDWLATELRLNDSDRVAVRLAACAHDVVYDGRPAVAMKAASHGVSHDSPSAT